MHSSTGLSCPTCIHQILSRLLMYICFSLVFWCEHVGQRSRTLSFAMDQMWRFLCIWFPIWNSTNLIAFLYAKFHSQKISNKSNAHYVSFFFTSESVCVTFIVWLLLHLFDIFREWNLAYKNSIRLVEFHIGNPMYKMRHVWSIALISVTGNSHIQCLIHPWLIRLSTSPPKICWEPICPLLTPC